MPPSKLAHLVFQRISLSFERLLLPLAHGAQRVGLAQVEIEGREACQCHERNADAGEAQ